MTYSERLAKVKSHIINNYNLEFANDIIHEIKEEDNIDLFIDENGLINYNHIIEKHGDYMYNVQ